MQRKNKKALTATLALALMTFAMVTGIFTTSPLQAQAAEAFSFVEVDSNISEADLAAAVAGNEYLGTYDPMVTTISNEIKANSYSSDCLFISSYEDGGFSYFHYFALSSSFAYSNGSFNSWSDKTDTVEHIYVIQYSDNNDTDDDSDSGSTPSGDETDTGDNSTSGSTPSGDNGNTGNTSSNNGNTDSAASPASHCHSYSWVITQEATVEHDGIEEYKCSCGDVQEKNTIPASEFFVKNFYGTIKDAPAGGTISFDSKWQSTISDYLIRKLAERNDVTVVVTFEYQKTAYQMTIPAGVDYTTLLNDETAFYGYLYFANAIGAVIEIL